MKVILLVDDKKIGKRHDVKEVADGFARNVLIPKKIAIEATKENLNKLNNEIAKEKREYELKLAEAIDTANKINDIHKISIKAECSKDGKMFGAVTSKDIADELTKKSINVKKQDVILDKPIKEFGTTTVSLKLFGGTSASLNVCVEAL